MATDQKTLWFRHDVGAMGDIRMQKIVRKYGMEGVGIYWYIVEALYSNDGKIFFSEIPDIAFMMHVSEEVVMTIVADKDVFESDEESFWSNRINTELSIQQEVTEKAKKSIEARWKNQKKAQKQEEITPEDPEKSYDRNTTVIRPNNERNTDVVRKPYDRNTQTDRQTEITDREEENICSELKEPEAENSKILQPPIIEIMTNTKKPFPVYQESIDLFCETYPNVDILPELKKIKAWSFANPKKRKTISGMMRFINSWLSKEQDKTDPQTRYHDNDRPHIPDSALHPSTSRGPLPTDGKPIVTDFTL